ncbi:tetratricopeptide repeat protein [Parablastomonas sp. CN1-191]|uniref:tetratricopeptide repeat protein n=1 Tax=Parablastomonas sp. CN1-191 TaxID=3400908 RepID=UPI003BF8F534
MALRPNQPPATTADQRNAAQQDVFMREVDDALRQDKMATVAKRYGKPIGAAVAIGLLGLAAWLGWDWYAKDQDGKRGERYVVALDKVTANPADPAGQEFAKLATEGGAASRASAALTQAALLLMQKKDAEAQAIYTRVAGDGSVPQPYRDLATLRSVATGFDAMPPQQVIARLKPLAVPGNAFFGSAGELVAMAYLKLNQPQNAGPLLAAVARDKSVPESLRSRTGQLAAQLGYDAVDQFIEARGGQTTAAQAQP